MLIHMYESSFGIETKANVELLVQQHSMLFMPGGYIRHIKPSEFVLRRAELTRWKSTRNESEKMIRLLEKSTHEKNIHEVVEVNDPVWVEPRELLMKIDNSKKHAKQNKKLGGQLHEVLDALRNDAAKPLVFAAKHQQSRTDKVLENRVRQTRKMFKYAETPEEIINATHVIEDMETLHLKKRMGVSGSANAIEHLKKTSTRQVILETKKILKNQPEVNKVEKREKNKSSTREVKTKPAKKLSAYARKKLKSDQAYLEAKVNTIVTEQSKRRMLVHQNKASRRAGPRESQIKSSHGEISEGDDLMNCQRRIGRYLENPIQDRLMGLRMTKLCFVTFLLMIIVSFQMAAYVDYHNSRCAYINAGWRLETQSWADNLCWNQAMPRVIPKVDKAFYVWMAENLRHRRDGNTSKKYLVGVEPNPGPSKQALEPANRKLSNTQARRQRSKAAKQAAGHYEELKAIPMRVRPELSKAQMGKAALQESERKFAIEQQERQEVPTVRSTKPQVSGKEKSAKIEAATQYNEQKRYVESSAQCPKDCRQPVSVTTQLNFESALYRQSGEDFATQTIELPSTMIYKGEIEEPRLYVHRLPRDEPARPVIFLEKIRSKEAGVVIDGMAELPNDIVYTWATKDDDPQSEAVSLLALPDECHDWLATGGSLTHGEYDEIDFMMLGVFLVFCYLFVNGLYMTAIVSFLTVSLIDFTLDFPFSLLYFHSAESEEKSAFKYVRVERVTLWRAQVMFTRREIEQDVRPYMYRRVTIEYRELYANIKMTRMRFPNRSKLNDEDHYCQFNEVRFQSAIEAYKSGPDMTVENTIAMSHTRFVRNMTANSNAVNQPNNLEWYLYVALKQSSNSRVKNLKSRLN